MKRIQDFSLMCVALLLAYYASKYLLEYTGEENNSALVFVLAVLIVSRFTKGYFYGMCAAVISVFLINYFFMHPFATFNMHISGYPVALISLLMVSVMISALTSRTIIQSEQNEKLYKQKTEMTLSAEKERIRSNLMRAVSHDLRTPLTGIIGASAVIAENGQNMETDEIRRLAANIEEDAQWLVKIMENLLSVTRINSDMSQINKKNEFIEEIVSAAIVKIKKRYPQAAVKVEASDDIDDIIEAPMDALLIEQVLINLIENAIKHAKNMTQVTLRYYRDGKNVSIEVVDDGDGFDYNNLEELIDFKLSERIELADGAKNAGIGLSVCRSIINAHDGVLEAENLEGGGAKFKFTIPGKG